MRNYITYYQDDILAILFSQNPHVDFRYPCPGDTEKEAIDKLEKPFINKEELNVVILYKKDEIPVKYEFIIEKDFTWDGASIPWLFWKLIGPKTDPKFMIASMIHDQLCIRKELVNYDRYLSTIVLEKLCKVGGTGPIKRWAMKHSVDNWQKIVGDWEDDGCF